MVAITHWHYMALRRLGATEDAARVLAPIHPHMAITENRPYYRLTLLYTGALTPEDALAPNADDKDKGMGNNQALMDATVGYGVANWHRYNGRRAEADALCRHIIDSTPPAWPSSPSATSRRRLIWHGSSGQLRHPVPESVRRTATPARS